MSDEPFTPIFPELGGFPRPSPPPPPAAPQQRAPRSCSGAMLLSCVLIGFLAAAVVNLLHARQRINDELAEAQRRYSLLVMQRNAQMELLTDPRTRLIALQPNGHASELGAAHIAWLADRREGVFISSGWRAPQSGSEYQLWTSAAGLDSAQRASASPLAYPQGVQSFSLPLNFPDAHHFFVVEIAPGDTAQPAAADVVFDGSFDAPSR